MHTFRVMYARINSYFCSIVLCCSILCCSVVSEAFAARLDRAIQREQKRRDGDDVDQSTDEFTQHECGVEQHETSAGTAGAGWCRRSADRRGWPERQDGSESQGCHLAASKKEQLPKNEVARVIKKCNPEC